MLLVPDASVVRETGKALFPGPFSMGRDGERTANVLLVEAKPPGSEQPGQLCRSPDLDDASPRRGRGLPMCQASAQARVPGRSPRDLPASPFHPDPPGRNTRRGAGLPTEASSPLPPRFGLTARPLSRMLIKGVRKSTSNNWASRRSIVFGPWPKRQSGREQDSH